MLQGSPDFFAHLYGPESAIRFPPIQECSIGRYDVDDSPAVWYNRPIYGRNLNRSLSPGEGLLRCPPARGAFQVSYRTFDQSFCGSLCLGLRLLLFFNTAYRGPSLGPVYKPSVPGYRIRNLFFSRLWLWLFCIHAVRIFCGSVGPRVDLLQYGFPVSCFWYTGRCSDGSISEKASLIATISAQPPQ